MVEHSRIEDLRRRVQKDPASIAFAQLAEECRRAGQYQEAVDVCRAGLAIHPAYLSARVTLGRALIELNELDVALDELTAVLKSAPENLAAIRGLAEIHHRRGELAAALAQYRAALALARNDPDLQRTVAELARQIEPPPPPPFADGLSFEQMQDEFLKLAPPPAAAPRDEVAEGVPPSAAPLAKAGEPTHDLAEPVVAIEPPSRRAPQEAASAPKGVEAPVAQPAPVAAVEPISPGDPESVALQISEAVALQRSETVALQIPETVAQQESEPVALHTEDAPNTQVVDSAPPPAIEERAIDEAALRTIAALERWLDAIHVARAERGA